MKGLLKRVLLGFLCICCICLFEGPGEPWAAAPRGKLVVAQGADPTTLDPHMHAEIPANVVLHNMFDFPVKRGFKDGKLVHEPMLATSWETTNDTTWIFHLRKGVKFHNGEDFNAEAFKFSLDRILNPAQKARRRYLFTSVDRVEIVDPYTVKVITKVPLPTLIINLGYGMSLVPPKYVKEKGDAYVANNPVGTGPFKFVRWVKDDEIVMEANESYWGGAPKIKTLVIKPIPETSTMVAALVSGDIDIAKKVPIHLFPMINKSNKAKIVAVPGGLTHNIHFDTKAEGPLRDKRVRQAINYAVDKDAIIKHVLEGYGIPVASPLNPSHFGYDPNLKPYPYAPEKAKALLKEAGYGDGFSITLNATSGHYVKDKEIVEAIAGQLGKVGINVKVQLHEYGSFMKKLYSPEGAGPMYLMGWALTFDADGILTSYLTCDAALSRYCNKQVDTLLAQGRSTLDEKKREGIYSQATQLIHEEATYLFLHQGYDAYGVSNRVQDWKPISDESYTLIMRDASVKD